MAVNIETSGLDKYGWEIGIFCALSCFISAAILQKINGDFKRLEGFFALKNWEFIENSPNVNVYAKMFKGIIIFMVTWPIWTLISWGTAVISSLAEQDVRVLPGVSILLIGFCIVFLVLGVMDIKFNNFRFTRFSLGCILLGLLFFFAFQLVALLLEDEVSFFGISAVFLTANSFIMIFIVSMLYSKDGITILEIIEDRDIIQSGASKSKEDMEDLNALIKAEEDDDNYQPTEEEIFQLFTLVNHNAKGEEIFDVQEKMKIIKNTALGGGLQSIYKETSPKKKVGLVLTFYLIAIGLLIAYTIIGYSYCKYTQQVLPIITTIAVITTDIIIFGLIKCKLADGPFQVTMLLLLFRALLFAFGGDLWFIGYCILYLCLGLILNYHIVNRRYPFFEQHSKTKFNCRRFFVYPEFLQILAFFLFLIGSLILEFGEFDRVPTEGFSVYFVDYDFYVFGIAALIFNIIIFCYMMSFRIYQRKMKGIQDFTKYHVLCKAFGPYYMFLLLTYIFIVLLGIVWYSLVEEYFFMFTCIFMPIIYEAIMILYYNWQLNDYKLIADITAYNNKMDKYKEMRENQRKKKKTFKQIAQKKQNTTDHQEDQQGDKSVNEMINDIEGPQSEEKKTPQDKKQDIQLFMGGASLDVMALKGDLTRYEDWREMGLSFFEAFKTGKLLKTDYNTIISIAVLLVTMIIYSACVAVTSDNWPLLGVTISVSILTIICIFLPVKQYFQTLARPSITQIGIAVFGFIVNFGWGAFYYFNQYDEDKKSGNEPQYYLSYFLFFLPWVISFFSFLKKYKDNKYKFSKIEIIILVISVIFALGMGFQFMYAKSVVGGIAILAFFFFVYYPLLIFHIYKKNNESLPRKYIYISLGIIITVCASSLIVSLILDDFNDFLGFSITYLVFNLIALIFSYTQLQQDFLNSDREPLFFSPWIYPIFKYNSDKGRIEKRTRPFGLFLFSCLLFLIWGVSVTIWVQPTSIGTALCNIALCLIFLVITTASTWSQINLYKVKSKLNPEVIKSSWLSAKREFLSFKNATANDQVETYQVKNKEKKQFKQELKDLKEAYGNDKGGSYFLDLKELYTCFYTAEQQESMAFADEIRLLIQFQLVIVLKGDAFRRREMKEYNTFIQSYHSELQSIGILFQKNSFSKQIEEIYENYKKQYDLLSQEQQQAVDNLQIEYKSKLQEKDKADVVRDEEEEKKRLEREKELEERMKARQDTSNIDWSQPLSEIRDCPEKFVKILERYRENKEKFVDDNFKTDDSTLTERSKDNCSKWQRPPEGSELIKQGYSPMDIRQGMCGNCYFLSALSVIGDKNFREVMMLDDERYKGFESEMANCGAYIVRFFFAGEPVYVIVDDQLPFITQGKNDHYLYASSEDDGEIWPQIIEKAYAKMYGGYGKIEGGKVAYAVMELIGGQPEEIELKQFQDNTDQFWQDLINFQKMGYVLGAGSPAHEMGDSAISDEGIVQGHAYSVLQVADLDGNKLIQLRNPHGNASAEWTGDWGDKSYLWNERMKKLAGCEFGEDGMFWMCVDDFVYEYRALYVCRTFPEDIWTTVPKLMSSWSGTRAAGLPTRQNPKALMQNNPHFGIRVTKKSNLFVSLTILEKDPEDPKQGKYPIYFMCQRNEGNRICGRSNDKMIGQSGMPIALTTVSAELNLKASTYPYTFSLMCATTEKGGESPFILQLYSSDKNVKILEDHEM